MPRFRWSILVAFAAWTLFVWATRLDNIWSDDAAGTSQKATSTLLALSFVAVAAGITVVAVRTFRRAPTVVDQRIVQVAAVWTVGVWIVRAAGIVVGDHDLAFVVVHVVLGLISVALALGCVAALRPSRSLVDQPSGVARG